MVELLCTLTGIIAGVAIVASLFHKQGERQKFSVDDGSSESDRILGIADQLQVISHRVAADVSAHSEKVVHISDRLSVPNKEKEPEKILTTINEIISANQAMQGQLVDAQMRIAQQSRLIEQASQQARTDALTGLSNRRALNEFISNSIEHTTATTFTGLVLMDIDHFKSFNDNFGHTTGDAVLASFARAISVCCGETSYAARYGGEEFAVVLSANSLQELVLKAAEVRYYVSEQTISYEDLQLKITASGGLCQFLPGDTCHAIYERADEGLYQAKKGGRNCGYWLSSEGWLPFPTRAGTPQILAELKPSEEELRLALGAAVVPPKPAAKGPASLSTPAPQNESPATSSQSIDFSLAPISHDEPVPVEYAPQPAENSVEILDLSAFLGRLEAFVEQLRKAGLPATAFMVEASDLGNYSAAQSNACWGKTVEVLSQNLRGIDVACLYRPHTLCVLLPGCSLDAGLIRAAKIKQVLLEASTQWNLAVCYEKLAVSVASVGGSEDNASFLNRLEMALEEAADSRQNEVVIHDGNTCHFQPT